MATAVRFIQIHDAAQFCAAMCRAVPRWVCALRHKQLQQAQRVKGLVPQCAAHFPNYAGARSRMRARTRAGKRRIALEVSRHSAAHAAQDRPFGCTASHAVASVAPLCAQGARVGPSRVQSRSWCVDTAGGDPLHTGQLWPIGQIVPDVMVPPWQRGEEMSVGTATIYDRLY
jgi:hypothetical protein